MNPIQKSVLAAVEDAMADKRQAARIRYHLRKRAMRLHHCPHQGPMAICRATHLARFQGSLDQIEAWAKGGTS